MRNLSKRRPITRYLLSLIALAIGLSLQSPAMAFASRSQQVISPGDMSVWENGAKVTKICGGHGSGYHASVRASTAGFGKGYYSVYLYDQTPRDLSAYDGISFGLQNKSSADLKINLTFAVDSGRSVSMSDASYAILESADHSMEDAISPTYGTVTVPGNFDGSIYVPLSKLYTSDGKNISLTKIQSWGITAVMNENQQIQYQMGDIRLLSGSVAAMRDQYDQITLSGEDSIAIPRLDSTMEVYQAQIKDMDGNKVTQNPTFYLKQNVTGVTLSNDGKLQVSSDCTASSVTVGVKLGNSVTFAEKTIALKQSTAAKGEAGISPPSVVPGITKPAYVTLNRWMEGIRIFACAVVLILLAIICKWFFVANRRYIRIRKKLLEMTPDHEGEAEP